MLTHKQFERTLSVSLIVPFSSQLMVCGVTTAFALSLFTRICLQESPINHKKKF